MMRSVAGTTAMALVMTGISGAQGTSEPPRKLALVNATVIDGTGGPATAGQTLVIEGNRIRAIFARGAQRIPADASVLDVAGKFVIPGLIDAHVHLATDPKGRDANAEDQLHAALLGGVTTVRDMAGDAIVLRDIASRACVQGANMARVYYAAVVAGPSFFTDPRTRSSAHGGTAGELPWLRALTPSSDIPTVVREAKATGATALKLYADLPFDLVARVTAEAHRQGMRVWSHATVFPSKPSDAVDAGVDALSHAILLFWDGASDVPPRYANRTARAAYDSVAPNGKAMQALFARIRTRGTVLDATLFVSARLEAAPAGTSGFAEPRRAVQWMYDVTRAANAAGVFVAAGTDGMMPGEPGEPPNLHRELELLVSRAGFTPLQAITAATRNSARAIGAADSLGTIEVGKVADLVVLAADPTADIRNTRRIAMVVRDGVVHRPSSVEGAGER